MLERLIRFIKYKILKIESPSRIWSKYFYNNKNETISVLFDFDSTEDDLLIRTFKEIVKYKKLGWEVKEIIPDYYKNQTKLIAVTIVFEKVEE